MLCSDRYSDLGEGATYQDTRLEVRAAVAQARAGGAMTAGHREAILDQFTRQAVPFSTAPGIKDEQALSPARRDQAAQARLTPSSTWRAAAATYVCAFARVVRHATGIDLAPAMMEQARALERDQGLANVS